MEADRVEVVCRIEGTDVLLVAREGICEAPSNKPEEDRPITTMHVTAQPRLALRGHVHVRPARPWDRLRPRHAYFADKPLDRALSVTGSSEIVARAVLDERVTETIRGLFPRFTTLLYSPEQIALGWTETDHDAAVTDDALACVAYLAAGFSRTPYR
jgi:hypothetical protein